MVIHIASPLVTKLLDIIVPLNYSRPLETILKVNYLVDHDKYYWLIYLHNSLSTVGVLLIIVAVDSYFMMIVQNLISMFDVLGYVYEKKNFFMVINLVLL